MATTREIIIAGNWKMNQTVQETDLFFKELSGLWKPVKATPRFRAILFPPVLSLSTAQTQASSLHIEIGIQNAHWEKAGAFTGEVSAAMCLEAGIHWSLVAHSERRQFFGETDETAGRRTLALLEAGMRVIFCVGETRKEREAGETSAVLTRQIQTALGANKSKLQPFLDGRFVIAYEPVWAIGTGLNATPAQAEEAHQVLRRLVWDQFGMQASGSTSILYGGSVNAQNIDALLACPNIDGALVGGASLKAQSYNALCESGAKALQRKIGL